jgi:O-methyltransferase involved in polyketide biosynthesis
MYLAADDVEVLLGRLDALSAPTSRAYFDLPSRALLDSPYLKEHLANMAKNGSPWLFGSDEPGLLLGAHGWSSTTTDPGDVGDRFHRWPIPIEIRTAPGFPRSFFVEATKR